MILCTFQKGDLLFVQLLMCVAYCMVQKKSEVGSTNIQGAKSVHVYDVLKRSACCTFGGTINTKTT